jgi:hypothetical protein
VLGVPRVSEGVLAAHGTKATGGGR